MKNKKHGTALSRILVILSLFLIIAILSTFAITKTQHYFQISQNKPKGPFFKEGIIKTVAETESTSAEITGARNNAIVQAIRKVGASVVSISTVRVVSDPWFEFFYPFGDAKRKYYGLGSGFIIDNRGYIVTNCHVIEDADVITVTLTNGKHLDAEVIGLDKQSDLAVLKVEENSSYTIAELGDSSNLLVGEWVIAIGNPFGYLMKDSQPTVTVGVISATGRSFQKEGVRLNNLIQTDAAINPGNSGGPLVNCYGQVIGINTAIFSTTGGYQGVGFAIPINTAKKIISKLIEHGIVKEPWLGIDFQELTTELAEHFGLKDIRGALISDVAKGGPADKAGLQSGDIVTKIADDDIRTSDEAIEKCRLLSAGEKVNFRIIRKGEFHNVSIEVEDDDVATLADRMFGFTVQANTQKLAKKYKLSSYKTGVVVIKVRKNTPADEAELKEGDLILRMAKVESDPFNDFSISEDIDNLNDFRRFISRIRKNQIVRIIFERDSNLWQTSLKAQENG
ncbi:MAG: trypsin-like peptidase domain-containing protein [Candidatus Poribacteria bacterium]